MRVLHALSPTAVLHGLHNGTLKAEEIAALGKLKRERGYGETVEVLDVLICEWSIEACAIGMWSGALEDLSVEPLDGGGVSILSTHRNQFLSVLQFAVSHYTQSRVLFTLTLERADPGIVGAIHCATIVPLDTAGPDVVEGDNGDNGEATP